MRTESTTNKNPTIKMQQVCYVIPHKCNSQFKETQKIKNNQTNKIN